jgi:hypothetical protein
MKQAAAMKANFMWKSTGPYRLGGNFDPDDEDNIFLKNVC